MTQKVLFICTGNYYRSRYAEYYFNALAVKQKLDWAAFSRGLATDLGDGNIGPIAPRVIVRLHEHGIALDGEIRYPIQLTLADLQEADLAIALYEPEHRRYMQKRFPEWEDRITYWQVPDLDQISSEVAFPKIEEYITTQIQHINKGHGQNQ